MPACKKCPKFSSAWCCSCNLQYKDHKTIVETREERLKQGRALEEFARLQGDFYYPPAPEGQPIGFGQAAAGLNSFSALADKYGPGQLMQEEEGKKQVARRPVPMAPSEKKSALELFNTPHGLRKVKMAIKKH